MQDTAKIRNQNAEIWDHLRPTFHNVRKIYDMADEILEQNKNLKSRLLEIENRIKKLEKE